MKTNNSQPSPGELPSYLGYGILDKASIQFKNGLLNASYVFERDNSLVHQVSWEENRCSLDTFCHGNRVRITSYPTLKQALLADCMSWTLNDDDCFQFLAKEVSKLGNIYVSHPKPDEENTSINYFPAGKLFLFSLPLLDKSPAYVEFLNNVKEDASIRFMRERKGLLLQAKPHSPVTLHPIVIADFVVPLAHLASAAQIMVEANIIQKEKMFRLIINEAINAESSLMQVFLGEENDSYFGICFKEIEAEKLEWLKEMFGLQTKTLSLF
ncbi:MAG TPA: hypothetical protein VLR49_10235 [Ferruginibacter sp.]|nr:hypothetical protein [Ferruginibacter sp.]